jgi:predicted membrane protein
VASELWFLYRKHFITIVLALRNKQDKRLMERGKYLLFNTLTLGTYDVSEGALHRDEKAVKILAGVGIPVACFLHGYAGFIFGSVKANALWMTPLMPVIFIMSAGVSGIALCMLTYIITMEIRKILAKRRKAPAWMPYAEELGGIEFHEIRITSKYLLIFLIFSVTLELLDLIFRGYTGVKSWDVLRRVIYEKDFIGIFVLQYGIGNFIPLILFSLPRITIRRALIGALMVLFGVFMMRWNVVIGGQAFSLSFAGYMHYVMPIVPHDVETFKEGLAGALSIMTMPFILFWIINKIFPVFAEKEQG